MFDKVKKNRENDTPPIVFFPNKYEDLDKIVVSLNKGHNVIVNVKNLDDRMRYRILDFLTGYSFALNHKREKLDSWIYLFKANQ